MKAAPAARSLRARRGRWGPPVRPARFVRPHANKWAAEPNGRHPCGTYIGGGTHGRRVPAEGFTIYGTARGYAAVTNPVRQRILRALEDGDRTLTELVDLTGKAKSTLSAVHLRDLLRSGLVEERLHDDDARVKVYRLTAKRIGTSSLPLDDLRVAVRSYVTSSQGALALPLASVVSAFDRLPPMEAREERWVALVGERLGTLAAAHLKAEQPAALLRELAEVWRREGLGPVANIRTDASGLEVGHANGGRPGGPRCALLRGFLQGALTTRSGRAAWVEETRCASRAKGKRCVFAIAWTRA
jgi:DNA-binding transcriptional ArsR family regulator